VNTPPIQKSKIQRAKVGEQKKVKNYKVKSNRLGINLDASKEKERKTDSPRTVE
jgi:hypothetical protein